ncbi:hypothetical protein TNCT_199071 [Trichonephila clavata]|uniref:Uncharacterized protein n=1 Tax=Trichonephila clavata TaxID=2740835 RepID=A0A8X6J3D1_TRICU|nr:hypothetical protein TNCT_199071 [Trichonephila clavata]
MTVSIDRVKPAHLLRDEQTPSIILSDAPESVESKSFSPTEVFPECTNKLVNTDVPVQTAYHSRSGRRVHFPKNLTETLFMIISSLFKFFISGSVNFLSRRGDGVGTERIHPTINQSIVLLYIATFSSNCFCLNLAWL